MLHIISITEIKFKRLTRQVLGMETRQEEQPTVEETINLVREMQAIRPQTPPTEPEADYGELHSLRGRESGPSPRQAGPSFVALMGRTKHFQLLIRATEKMTCNYYLLLGTRDRKVAGSNPGRSGGRIFFSAEFTFVCPLLFDVRLTPVLLQWHVKDPGHSAKSAGGRFHLNTHSPVTPRSRGELIMPLSEHSEGTY